MDGLKGLINRSLVDFPAFDYYLAIIEKAERNVINHPDITIECCNSLIQGISKTIILNLELDSNKKDLDRSDTDQLFKRCLKCLALNDDVYEDDFVRRGVSLALAISTLRNARGDISHGKAVPKELSSDMSLSLAILEITSVVLRYTLASYFSLEIEKRTFEKGSEEDELTHVINYEDNADFNDFLDDLYPLDGKVLYSLALYDGYYEDYQLQLDGFMDSEEQELTE